MNNNIINLMILRGFLFPIIVIIFTALTVAMLPIAIIVLLILKRSPKILIKDYIEFIHEAWEL